MMYVINNFAAGIGNNTSVGIAQIIGFIAYFAPYFAIAFAARLATGIVGNIAGFVNDRHRGAFDRLKGFRGKARANRYQKFAAGSLFQDKGLGRVVNAVGTSVGTFQAGAGIKAFAPGRRGRSARALYTDKIADEALKNNPLLNQLQNFDQANNILALSGGTEFGLRQAANDLGLTGGDRRAAIAAARAVGVNRQNALAALKSSSHNKWRGVGAGDIQSVDRGIQRLANNGEEYSNIAEGVSALNRGNGRLDLGGRSHIDWRRNNADWQAARTATGGAANSPVTAATWQNMSDRTMRDAYGRATLQQVHGGHDNQVIQAAGTWSRQLRASAPGSDAARDAARNLYELTQHNFSSGSGRDVFNGVVFGPAVAGGAPTNNLQLDANLTNLSLSQQLSLMAEHGVMSPVARDAIAGGGVSMAGIPMRAATPNEIANGAPAMVPTMSQYDYALSISPAAIAGGQPMNASAVTTTGRGYADPRYQQAA